MVRQQSDDLLMDGLDDDLASALFSSNDDQPQKQAPAQQPARITTTTSLTTVKMRSRFSDPALFKSVLSYKLPAELESAVDKCRQGLADECFFSLKGFEADANPAVAAAATGYGVLRRHMSCSGQELKLIRAAARIPE